MCVFDEGGVCGDLGLSWVVVLVGYGFIVGDVVVLWWCGFVEVFWCVWWFFMGGFVEDWGYYVGEVED